MENPKPLSDFYKTIDVKKMLIAFKRKVIATCDFHQSIDDSGGYKPICGECFLKVHFRANLIRGELTSLPEEIFSLVCRPKYPPQNSM